MSVSSAMIREHREISSSLVMLAGLCSRLESGERVDPSQLHESIEYVWYYLERVHHGKEELYLFPAMLQAGMSARGGVINDMVREHGSTGDAVEQMRRTLGEYRENHDGAAGRLAEELKGFIKAVREHIDIEDRMIMPLADMLIGAGKQKQLLAQFDNLESERLTPQQRQTYHQPAPGMRRKAG